MIVGPAALEVLAQGVPGGRKTMAVMMITVEVLITLFFQVTSGPLSLKENVNTYGMNL
jgi:hypothetical protein